MQATSPTRMNLLARRRQLALATQGSTILGSKRSALLRELMALARPLAHAYAELAHRLYGANLALTLAEGMDGRCTLRSLSFLAAQVQEVGIQEEKVWGARIPRIDCDPLAATIHRLEQRAAPTGTSMRVIEAAREFEETVRILLRVAPLQARMVRLGAEVRRTSRRINALDRILIPRLHADIKQIGQALEEVEREDMFRLRRIKKKKARRS